MINPKTTRKDVLTQLLPSSVDSNDAPTNIHAVFAMSSLIRAFEERLFTAFTEGKIDGTIHTALGQETHDVGLMWSLDPSTDNVFGNHRNHGQLLAWGAAPDEVFAEIMGRQAGLGGGFGGSQHMSIPGFHSSGVQGGLAGVAVGVGLASKRSGSNGISNVLLGDGTLGQGILYEAMNIASVWDSPTLFTVIDNAIAQTTPSEWTVSGDIASRGKAFDLPTFESTTSDYSSAIKAAEQAVAATRSNSGPALLVVRADRLGPHSKGDDHRPQEMLDSFTNRDPLKLLKGQLDEQIAIDIENAVEETIQSAFQQADSSPHAVNLPDYSPRFSHLTDSATNPILAAGESRTINSLNEALRTCIEKGAVLLGEDLHDPYGGAFKVTQGLSTSHPENVLSSPISEAAMVGTAIGLALSGTPTVAEIMFGDFITLATDQIVNQASKLPSIYGRDQQLPVTIRMPSGGYRGYGPTHSQSLESMFMGLPNISVVAATHRVNSGELLRRAVQDWAYPTIFVENKLLYSEIEDSRDYEILAPETESLESIFPTLVRKNNDANTDVTLIGYGGMVPLIEWAAEILLEEELSVSIIIPTLLSPLPIATIATALNGSPITIVVEEGQVAHGFGSELVASLAEKIPHSLGRIERIGAIDSPIPASRMMEEQVLPTVTKIVDTVLRIYESESN